MIKTPESLHWLKDVNVASPTDDYALVYDSATGLWGAEQIDHGALAGLSDDDHANYHTDARGDARYLYRENTVAFTPDGNYEPATKKYVDDAVSDAGGGDMTKAVYDQDDDGIVDNSESLEGSTKAQVQDHNPKVHASSHEDTGADEISVAGLSGELADPQPSNFLKLSDTPASYSGQVGKFPKVNSDEDALEFMTRCAIRAKRTSTQSITGDGSAYVVQLNTEDYDLGDDFDSTSTYRFTAPVTGYYAITAMAEWDFAVANAKRYAAAIRIDGTADMESHLIAGTTERLTNTIADFRYLTSTQTVDLVVGHNTGLAKNLRRAYLTVHLIHQ